MYDISNVQRKPITADQAERPLESSLPQLLSHCQILLSQGKEFTLQGGWSGNFLRLSSMISPEGVRWMARRTHFTCIWGCQGGSWILGLYIKDRAYPLILGGDSCPRMLSSLDSFAWLPPAVLGQGPEGFPGLCWGGIWSETSWWLEMELFVYWPHAYYLLYVARSDLAYLSTALHLSEGLSWTRVRKVQPPGWLPHFVNNV